MSVITTSTLPDVERRVKGLGSSYLDRALDHGSGAGRRLPRGVW